MTAGSPEQPAGPPRDATELQLVEVLGSRYRLGAMLGRGGMGAVYRATDTMLDREVAIKVIPPDLARNADIVSRFEREAKTAARLDHPGIIPIYSVERAQDLSLFIMKFVSGRDLEKVMEAGGTLSIDFCRRVIWEAACALGHAHQRGVVHRDIKPANIMLDESDRVLVADFGIAKASDSLTQLTQTGMMLGTPQYMSPEQAMGDAVNGASDQYSLGMTAYHLLTGAPAFPATSVHGLIYKHIHEEPSPIRDIRPDVPEAMANAIARALAKDPAARFPTMEEFATALWPERPVAASGGSATYVIPVPTPASSAGTRIPRWAIAAGAVVVIGGAALAWPRGDAPTERPTTAATDDSGAVAGTSAQDLGTPATPAGPTQQATSNAQPSETPVRPAPAAPPPVNAPASAPATAPAQGFVTVDANPFGTVYIDGAEIGDTPIFRHAVTPGRHIIEIRRVGFRSVVDTVEVASGANARISRTLLP